jgi:hypothetical protein
MILLLSVNSDWMFFILDVDIGSASESLKPGAVHTQERPGTVPKAKSKYNYAGQT